MLILRILFEIDPNHSFLFLLLDRYDFFIECIAERLNRSISFFFNFEQSIDLIDQNLVLNQLGAGILANFFARNQGLI